MEVSGCQALPDPGGMAGDAYCEPSIHPDVCSAKRDQRYTRRPRLWSADESSVTRRRGFWENSCCCHRRRDDRPWRLTDCDHVTDLYFGGTTLSQFYAFARSRKRDHAGESDPFVSG